MPTARMAYFDAFCHCVDDFRSIITHILFLIYGFKVKFGSGLVCHSVVSGCSVNYILFILKIQR